MKAFTELSGLPMLGGVENESNELQETFAESPICSGEFASNLPAPSSARVSEPGSGSGSVTGSDRDDPKALHAELMQSLNNKFSEFSGHFHTHAKEFIAEVLLGSIGLQDAAQVLQHINTDKWAELNKDLTNLMFDFLNSAIVPEVDKIMSGTRTPVSTLNLGAVSPKSAPMPSLQLSEANLQALVALQAGGSWPERAASPTNAPNGPREMGSSQFNLHSQALPGQWVNPPEVADQFANSSNAGSIIQALSSASPESQREFAELLGQVSKQLSTDPAMLLLHLESLSTSVQASNIFDELAPSVREKILGVCEKCAPYIKVEHFDSGVRHWLVQIQSLFGEVHAISSLEALEQAANLEGIRKMKAFITTRLIDHYEHLVWAQDPQLYARGKLQPDMYLMLCELIHSKKGLCWSHFDPKVLDAMREVRGIEAVRQRLQKLCMKELAGVTNVPAYLYTLLNKRSLVGMSYPAGMTSNGSAILATQMCPLPGSHADHRPRGHARTAAAATARTTRARIFETGKGSQRIMPGPINHFSQGPPAYNINAATGQLGAMLISSKSGIPMTTLGHMGHDSMEQQQNYRGWNSTPATEYGMQSNIGLNTTMWSGWL